MQGTGQKLNVLSPCTGNSCRGQMAEGWARRLKGDVVEAYSAGIEPRGLDPRAVRNSHRHRRHIGASGLRVLTVCFFQFIPGADP